MENRLNEHLKIIREIAQVLAEEQVIAAEQDMRNNPDQFQAFHMALRAADEARANLEQRVDDHMLVDEFDSAHVAFADALAIETYMRGVLCCGRLCHALSSGELFE